jgi:hypothetical protein
MDPSPGYCATEVRATRVGGIPAVLLDVRTTVAVFVAEGRGWQVGCSVVVTGAARRAVLRDFTRMLGTFQLRSGHGR